METFPKDFLWGAATSSYQVEGDNVKADWWAWEEAAGKERSGRACCHYEFYGRDFDLAQGLAHNAHRLSVEWSRIEPEEGRFSERELRHYVDVVCALRARHIEPIVTLHHFTNPAWLSKQGGWEKKNTVDLFLRYCDTVVRALGPHVRYWVTINEPTIYASHAYLFGMWPPQKRSFLETRRVLKHLALAHVRAYRLIHKIYRESKRPGPSVGFSQYTQAFVPCTTRPKDRFAAYLRDKWFNFGFIDAAFRRRAMDFIGLNYYSRQLVEVHTRGLRGLVWDVCENNHHALKKNSLGWDIYPQGLYGLLLKLKKYGLPVIITENGICTEDDGLRWDYIHDHLKNVHLAVEKGVPVKGYLYWSLLDNFEWDKGFGPRFGLVEIDYKTCERRVRDSAKRFAQVCRTGVLGSGGRL